MRSLALNWIESSDEKPWDCGRIYDRYRPKVYRLAVAALADHHAAEDVVQEVFIAVLRKLPPHLSKSGPALEAWLATTTRREVGRAVRRRLSLASDGLLAAREHRGEADLRLERADGWPSDPGLARAFDLLPLRQRQALALRFTLDFSQAETARAMGSTPEAIKELQRRALATLERAVRNGDQHNCEVVATRHGMRRCARFSPVLAVRKLALVPARIGRRWGAGQPDYR